MHSGCDNDPIDLEGLHESVVDSDEDLADSMDVSTVDSIYTRGKSLNTIYPNNLEDFQNNILGIFLKIGTH